MAAFDFPVAPTIDQIHDQNGVQYIWTGTVWDLVPTTDTKAGIGLELRGNIIDLQVANTENQIGGVRIPPRSPTQGLELDDNLGFLTAPQATSVNAGTIVEPPKDGVGYVRKTDAVTGIADWTLASDVVDVGIGLEFNATTPNVIDLKPATETEIGGLTEPRPGPASITYVRSAAKEWVPLPPIASPTDYGIGLSVSPGADPNDNQIVNLTPAGLTPPLLGGVWVPPRTSFQGLDINDPARPGMLVAPFATDQLAGVMTEPPVGAGQLWARTNSGNTSGAVPGKWEPVFNIGTLTYKGAWKPATNDPNIGAIPNKLSGDFWVVDCVDANVEETPPVGSTPGLDGVMVKESDWVIWNEPAQVFNHISQAGLQFNIGLEQIGLVVNVTPARMGDAAQGIAPEIGGVYATKRDDNQALALDTNGHISVPLATDLLAGSILEPPADGKSYSRENGKWVATTAAVEAGIGLDFNTINRNVLDLQPPKSDPVAGTPQMIGGVVAGKRDETQGLEISLLGLISVPLATDTLAGSIVEPPGDDRSYGRVRSAAGVSSWTPTEPPAISISVDPPPNGYHGQQWWDNDSGSMYLFYSDPSDTAPGAGQWVQTNGSGGAPSSQPFFGDVKNGFQVTDHGGWIKLDGRDITTLTPTQQREATALGFAANLPNATGSVPLQNGGVPGAISGSMSKTIAVANLPAHNMTAASSGAHTHTTDNVGGHEHPGERSVYGSEAATTKSTYDRNYPTETRGAHAHVIASAGAHTHTVALGGSGTALNITPQAMAVNMFVYLGN